MVRTEVSSNLVKMSSRRCAFLAFGGVVYVSFFLRHWIQMGGTVCYCLGSSILCNVSTGHNKRLVPLYSDLALFYFSLLGIALACIFPTFLLSFPLSFI